MKPETDPALGVPAVTSKRKRTRDIAWFAAKLSVSVALLTLIIRHLGSDKVIAVFKQANHSLLALGIACILGQTAISTLKWQLLLRQQGKHIPYIALLRAYLVGNFINLFMPSVLGGDAYRTAWLRRHTGNISASLPSILLDRVTGLVALVTLASVGLTLLFAPTRIVEVLCAAGLAATVMYLVTIGPIYRLLLSTRSGVLLGARRVLVPLVAGIRPSITLAWVLALSLLFQLNTVLINWLYSVATDIEVELQQLLVIVPAVYMVEMLPLSINGVGLREGAFAVLFAKAGLLAEHGLVLGLTVSVMRYIAGLAGGILLGVSALRQHQRTQP